MRTLPYLFLALFLYGCIDAYTPKGVESLSRLLVVEGNITDGESVFRLSRSIALDAFFVQEETTVDHASLYVEQDNGERLEGVFREKGTYIVSTGSLEANRKYRLHIAVDGEVYCSEYLSPIFTAGIDSITSVKERIGEPVQIRLYTHDPEDRSKYYMWNYKEFWEVKAELYATYGPWEGEFIDFSRYSKYNTYYCWARDSSQGLIMASSERQSENVIDHKITEIYSGDRRLSEYYCIEVNQHQVRQETYDYYANVQKNVEQTGDLFSSIPSELKGNISCISDPDLPVIGFCDVTTTVRERFYIIDLYDGYYEPPMQFCHDSITESQNFIYPVYGLYAYYINITGDTIWQYAPHRCVDCRLTPGATKENRPDFWPSGHY